MTVLDHTQEIDRPVADVFDVVIHAGDFASWNPTIKSSRQLSPDPIGEGTTVESDLQGFGAVKQELQEFVPNRRVRIVPHHRSLAGGHRFTVKNSGVEPASTTSSR
jgi:Polyketide cyclase / dehydrase and lipid transport